MKNMHASMRWLTCATLGVFCAACPGELGDEQLLRSSDDTAGAAASGDGGAAEAGTGAEAGSGEAGSGGATRGAGGSDAVAGGAAGTAAAGAGGTGAAGQAADAPSTACMLDVVQDIFMPKCSSAGCHGGSAPQAGIDFSVSDPSDQVFGIDSSSANDCGGLPLADPADPEGSVLLKILTPEHCGPTAMPPGAPLADEEITCVRAWIEAGGTL